MLKNALLALEDGRVFYGKSIGVDGDTYGEVVFNTSMTGYQEILTDPSYAKQIIAFTYPHIGNTGTNQIDIESDKIYASGMIIRDLPILASNWRSENTLKEYLIKNNVVAISGIDTRSLICHLRKNGAIKGYIVTGDNIDKDIAVSKANAFSGLKNLDLAKIVSTNKNYKFNQGVYSLVDAKINKKTKDKFKIIVYDFGVKKNILRILVDKGCDLTIVNAKTTVDKILAMNPDGVFLSNGPGDPEPCDYAIYNIQTLLEKNIPMFGICLGHQLLALAAGAKTYKMKLGHHGANHPVKDLRSNKVMITSQNHGFAISDDVPDNLTVTHVSLFDNSIQGIKLVDKLAFGFQGHPEASPGPHDASYLFDEFIKMVENEKVIN
jgi:carbamoyl-phosphate synthase small subunit